MAFVSDKQRRWWFANLYRNINLNANHRTKIKQLKKLIKRITYLVYRDVTRKKIRKAGRKVTRKAIRKEKENIQTLLLRTIYHESDGLKSRVQYDGGPARGISQVEPTTAKDIVRYVSKKPDLQKIMTNIFDMKWDKITKLSSKELGKNLVKNDAAAILMARIKYIMYKEPVPDADDKKAQAKYWKKYYNPGGKGKEEEFIEKTTGI
ncbi:MAG: hypothetical protein KAT43_01325 [Nanoarchaeota archaeon]|nr:hypothetical protein [Nanoarchaeota archaeon]